MDRQKVPYLRTEIEVANYRTDTTHTWADLCDAHDLLRARLGVREGDRLWRLGGQIVDIRTSRPGCATGWCPVCAEPLTLIDHGMVVPGHMHPDRGHFGERCPGSGRPGLDYQPDLYTVAPETDR